MKQHRNYGIDILKILSMFMIILLHLLGHGGVLKNTEVSTTQYNTAWLLETASYCAVNCYALVSGYVSAFHRDFKLSNYLLLWVQVLFYNAIFTVWGTHHLESTFTWSTFISILTPVSSSAYWYFTAYTGMYFLLPFFKSYFNNTPPKKLLSSILTLTLLFCILPTFQKSDSLRLDGGYHALWLIYLYIIGAYIKQYCPLNKTPGFLWLLSYIAIVLLSWGNLLIKNHYVAMGSTAGSYINLIQYTSPTILLAAISLLMFFSKINVGYYFKPIVSAIAPLTFGVYLIHDNKFVRNIVIRNSLQGIASERTSVLILSVLLLACCIFVVCILFDAVRNKLFQILHIKEIIKIIDKKTV